MPGSFHGDRERRSGDAANGCGAAHHRSLSESAGMLRSRSKRPRDDRVVLASLYVAVVVRAQGEEIRGNCVRFLHAVAGDLWMLGRCVIFR